MEQAIVNFLGNNHKQIEALYEARKHFIEYAKQKLEVVKGNLIEQKIILMESEVDDFDDYPDIGAYLFSHSISLHQTAIENDITYYFDIVCSTSGTCLMINWDGNLSKKRNAPSNTIKRLKNILDELQLEYDDMEDFADDAEYVIIKKLKWDASPEDIVTEFLPALKKIESALNLDKES